ncbi:HNH endonuclease signature motif containing protein [Bowmanella dokdonensis]|uniref:HNH endonuclease n=1 Tax=Bowmanella dokdonensis TaxID=751969 RepID=A0A939DRC5_9ALTE|nr:HNH endonuclease signature motif containing protein [Bowmanella dokdonensis]MBN7827375.1 HNH endonuclease [Bowmanella dokdonensis]
MQHSDQLQAVEVISAQQQKRSISPAPLGSSFLEVHHVIRLADNGPDTIDNAVALCPNCHRALHYADDMHERRELLYETVSRLRKIRD